jgi:hypothetical protein
VNNLFLPPRLNGEQAAQFFSRPRLLNLYGLLAPSVRVAKIDDPASRVPPFVERLWLPAYAVCLRTVSSKGERRMWTSVEAITGEFTLMECQDLLEQREVKEDIFPAVIDETQTVDIARKGLLRFIMLQRGQFDKPIVEGVEEIRPYHFAVWVFFYRRRKRFMDIKVFDAYSGKSAGAKMRVAVLSALVAARKSRQVV